MTAELVECQTDAMRIAVVLTLLNYLAFGMFIAVRPSAGDSLNKKDSESKRGEFSIISGEPYTYIADRPLRTWSEWHGGEHPAVKLLEVVNAPALFAAGALTPVVGLISGASEYHGSSWVRAWLLVAAVPLQWLAVGRLVSTRGRKSRAA